MEYVIFFSFIYILQSNSVMQEMELVKPVEHAGNLPAVHKCQIYTAYEVRYQKTFKADNRVTYFGLFRTCFRKERARILFITFS